MTIANRLNPWGLTARQMEIMSALCRLGNGKRVAVELGLEASTVRWHMNDAIKRIGVKNRLLAVLEFDRRERMYSRTAMVDPAMRRSANGATTVTTTCRRTTPVERQSC